MKFLKFTLDILVISLCFLSYSKDEISSDSTTTTLSSNNLIIELTVTIINSGDALEFQDLSAKVETIVNNAWPIYDLF